MEQLTEPTLFAFLLQSVILVLYLPVTYVTHRWIHAPMKRDRVVESMSQLGVDREKNWGQAVIDECRLSHYFWPLLTAGLVIFLTYALTHPYVIQSGVKVGLLEEVINVFGPDNPFERAVPVARALFWGWVGAYLYSFVLTFRRLMDYDLTPRVYIFICNRFLLAFVVGGMVSVGLGTFLTAAGMSFNVSLATVSVVAFFIGFFPEQGLNWITATAQKALRQQGGIVREIRLSEVEGISIWQQGRLRQENIDNVQNLATVDIPTLVMETPFTVGQIVDWVDQAILMIHTVPAQLEALARAGVSRASDLLVTAADEASLADLAEATGLKPSELRVLFRVLQSGINVEMVSHFCWQSSLDQAVAAKAAILQPLLSPAAPEK